ncbi:unnamed protein product [Closterium sp. NIES-65]|nr:unnamed protein product [Closterium sp. NIES-65]
MESETHRRSPVAVVTTQASAPSTATGGGGTTNGSSSTAPKWWGRGEGAGGDSHTGAARSKTTSSSSSAAGGKAKPAASTGTSATAASPSPPSAVMFSEMGQASKDLFSKGFSTAQVVALSAVAPGSVSLTTMVTKVQQLVMGLVTATVPLPGDAVCQVSASSLGQITSPLLPRLFFPSNHYHAVQTSVKVPEMARGLSATVAAEFPPRAAASTISLGPPVNTSTAPSLPHGVTLMHRTQYSAASAGTTFSTQPVLTSSLALGGVGGGVCVGGEVAYDTASQNLIKSNAAAAYLDMQVRDVVHLQYAQDVDEKLAVGLYLQRALKDSSKDNVAYALKYQVDDKTQLKGKFNSNGLFHGWLQHTLGGGATMSVTAEVDTSKAFNNGAAGQQQQPQGGEQRDKGIGATRFGFSLSIAQ